ncbi:MAG: nuclear transport factor 2 family protein [Candidatus Kariarchaeaceae archaeon]|jgi:hypothetical protein
MNSPNISISEKNNNQDIEIIKDLIIKSYIEGIHTTQNPDMVKLGFHPDFRMLVLQNDDIESVSVEEWFPRIEHLKESSPKLWEGKTTYKFDFIDCQANIANVKISVWKNEIFFSSDYMLLYKFINGWKIVSKIFTINPPN